ncbi:putative gtpase activating protein [Botrytis fragariae]|uniref:Putative gtpase activating protein n=1 Tax=Botrytis fragariae TaxID=1964551 RepID=A0A8H6AVN2_9HELO|nr:putative gtpase activating protein [Botrytis fragariae]KAF5874432.1 putative gtpase activating protein [Botrytis fragariae]
MESTLDRIVEDKIHQEGQAMQHDSMVTVRLSEPPILTLDTKRHSDKIITNEESETSEEINTPTDKRQTMRSIMDVTGKETETGSLEDSPRITMVDPNGNEVPTPTGSESAESEQNNSRRASDSSDTSVEEVNWEELEKTEEQQPRNQDSDDSTALLLARLEQENNAIASNPKSGIAKVQKVEKQRARAQSRPPSMQHLKKLVNGPTPSALRYSVTPPPPMTDLEFYAALVQDYPRTAQYLPTLLSKKIRSGIPPPLRGVVWQSMSGARDRLLEEQFDRLCGESSPYEGIIGKDLGRSFPGVEMFRDPEGDGQRMLGRVLKCFSLYDHKIGYCQGLGFLVGPLLMHMGDKQAFCVLVRLMEHYDLRNCFLPDLSGLHVRIHQFRELLKLHLPALSTHLDVLQVEPAYVSQWFLSFFATTCPLPMLFRIYDVIFAEGASETIMRVALSLMRKNETKILSCTEFEDVMQLLLSRGLWDVYHYNADEFVNDFVSLTGIVTHESLQNLEAGYRESQIVDTAIPSDVGSAASRFLGRLWAGSNSSTKSANLTPSPGLSAPSRPVSFLRRSPSKQSLASTLNSIEGSGSESMLSTSTDATSVSRDSATADGASIRAQSFASVSATKTPVNKDKNLHSQIEDLLMALSEMQRDHAILATELQREREEREEDRTAVQPLIDALRKKTSEDAVESSESDVSVETVKGMDVIAEEASLDEVPRDEELATPVVVDESEINEVTALPIITDDISNLLDIVEDRFQNPVENRRSSMMLTRSQLREELDRSKEQLLIETSRSQELSRRIVEQDQEISNLRDQIRETQAHVRNSHQDRQRLEKQVYDLRNSRKSAQSTPDGSRDHEIEWGVKSATTGGLRELKLVRSNSNRSVATTYNKRTSSLISPQNLKENENFRASTSSEQQHSPKDDVDSDSLVLELVQAKTAEAVAKQEAEEAKLKLESLKKMLAGLQNGEMPTSGFGHSSKPSLDRSMTTIPAKSTVPKIETPNAPASVPATPAPASGGGFWGWGKKAAASAEGK